MNRKIDVWDWVFILIDDILSTWSTLKNCAIAIKKEYKNCKIYWFVIASDSN